MISNILKCVAQNLQFPLLIVGLRSLQSPLQLSASSSFVLCSVAVAVLTQRLRLGDKCASK